MPETWKDVCGYEGYYVVSNTGVVRSVDRVVVDNNGKKYHYKSRILKQHKDRAGYLRVPLCRNAHTSWHFVHRLVAKAFIENSFNLLEVNHKDEDKENNCVENLEWCDRKYNVNYGAYADKMSVAMTNNTHNSKPVVATLPDGTEEVYPSMAEAGFTFTGRRNAGSIFNVLKGKQRTAYGRKWRYA